MRARSLARSRPTPLPPNFLCYNQPMEKDLISIIIPIYKVEKYVAECLKSVQSQDYKNLEIICIDDGSPDKSGAIVAKLQKSDPRITILTQSNQGLSAARNAGLRVARGEYVMFMDSDDYLEPNVISKLHALALETKSDLVVGSYYEFTEGKKPHSLLSGATTPLTQEEALRRLLREEGFMIAVWGKLYRRSLFRGIEFPVGHIHEDVGTTYKLFLKATRIAYLSLHTYAYRLLPNSITHAPFTLQRMDLIAYTDEMCAAIAEKYPSLKETCELRRVRARLGVLRQLPNPDPKTGEPYCLEPEILSFLAARKSLVYTSHIASPLEKLSLQVALKNPTRFRQIYAKLKSI